MEQIGVFSITNKISKLNFLKSTLRNWKLFGSLGMYFILIAAYSFLAYKLITFNQYEELVTQWKGIPLSQFAWLVGVLMLLPMNWMLEAMKWKLLVRNVQIISLPTSVKAVLAGISTGFFTPNRVGELVGRLVFLDVDNRKSGVTLSVVNSLTQNIIMALCGIPACFLFFTRSGSSLNVGIIQFLLVLIACLLVFGLFYFALPHNAKRFSGSRLSAKTAEFTACLSDYNLLDLLRIMFISLLRYTVFCTQFYFMLRFFGVQLELWHALIAIPTSYLFVTFTPSLAFSEAAVRSSYAVLFIGAFSGGVVGIALAGVCIWLVNFVVPMLVGSVVVLKR